MRGLLILLLVLSCTVATAQESPLEPGPGERLAMGQAAFRRADYAQLVPLLDSLSGADSPLGTIDERVQARELVVVGHFFLAQQATKSAERDGHLQRARGVSLELLREKPEHSLDTLIFPASVVDLFEAVRHENAEELNRLLAERDNVGSNGTQTVYLERTVVQRRVWVNLLPFGAGQFQNGELVKGTTFAFLQGGALALNITSYWMILRLRDSETGRFSAEGGQVSDLARARRWRQALYGGLIGFGAAWAISAIDGWLNFSPETVRIRTLDAPPPELGGVLGAGQSRGLELGLSLDISW